MANFKLSSTQVLDKSGFIQNFPPGTILPYFGQSIPTGWLLCDGSSYSYSSYRDLYDVIGITYGGVALTSFLVPNMVNYYPASSNNDNVTNYNTTHTHTGNHTTDATATTHSVTHSHTGNTSNVTSSNAAHNTNTDTTNVNGGITPGSNANSFANRAVNPGPAANSPQIAWVGHTHNAGGGTINVAADNATHSHTTGIGFPFNSSGTAVAHTVNSSTFTTSSSGGTLTSLKAYFIIKY